jgi:hypothetical protein
MPIPVGRSGNVDGEGGTTDGAVRPVSVADAGGLDDVSKRRLVREWVESLGFQYIGTVRRPGSARLSLVAESGEVLFAAFVAPIASVDELPNDADSDGTDGS